jgi:hypothetical protein
MFRASAFQPDLPILLDDICIQDGFAYRAKAPCLLD